MRPSRPPGRSESVFQFEAEDFAAARDGAAVLFVVGDEGHPAAARAAEDVVGNDAVAVDHVVRPPEPDVALEVVLVPVHEVDLLRDEAEERTPPRIEGCDLRSEEHTSELQSRSDIVCRLLLEKKKDT